MPLRNSVRARAPRRLRSLRRGGVEKSRAGVVLMAEAEPH